MAWMLMVYARQGASGEIVFNCHNVTIKARELGAKQRAKEQQRAKGEASNVQRSSSRASADSSSKVVV
eukprot:scaffold147079_cov15-Tisochrysis_lutea.AAC.1